MGILQKHTAKLRRQSEEIASLKRVVADLQERLRLQEGLRAGRAAGSWLPELASQEELVLVDIYGLAPDEDNIWLATRQVIHEITEGEGEEAQQVLKTENDEDDLTMIRVVGAPNESLFPHALGIVRYACQFLGEPIYMVIASEGGGMPARIQQVGSESWSYYWWQAYPYPGQVAKSHEDSAYGLAVARQSYAQHPTLAHRHAYADDTVVDLHWDRELQQFYFVEPMEPQYENCTVS